MNIKDLTSTEIIVRATGELQESNLEVFEQQAKDVLSSINTKLETDEDFGQAKEDIKDCKKVEVRIANISSDITHGMATVSEAITILGNLEDDFRETRLNLNHLVKSEEDRRKKEIVNTALQNIQNRINVSPVAHGFTMDRAAVYDAIKGKRSLKNMNDAVEEVVATEIDRIIELEGRYETNILNMSAAEMKYPGLFPDKKSLALEFEDVVEIKIGYRIEKYKNDILASEERKASEEIQAKEKKPEPPAFDPPLPPDPFSEATFDDPPIPYTTCLNVEISGDVQTIIATVLDIPGVVSVKKIM